MSAQPLREAPRDLHSIATLEESLVLPQFTSDDAYFLGTSLRSRIRALTPLAACISITLSNSSTLLFHATTRPGIQPDNDIWVSRKRATVLRWGVSSWFMHVKFKGDERAFVEKYGLGEKGRGEYAIHGGGVPIRVTGVEGIVGVVVVSGLKQEEDHMCVVEGLEALKGEMERDEEGRRKDSGDSRTLRDRESLEGEKDVNA